MIDYQKELNTEQLRVVRAGDGPCLVLAGAGTGKTRTIVYRVAYLLEQGVSPEKILLVTFTNKAAREMLGRISALMGGRQELHLPWAGTFHHVGNLILRRYGSKIGVEHNYTILDEADSRNVVKNVMAEFGFDKEQKNNFSHDLIHNLISYATNSVRNIKEVIEEWLPKQKQHFDDIARIAARYEQKKRQGNMMDFDDLLLLWLRLIQEHPEIKQKLSDKFEYILIDEYQDTNRLQGMIVEELAQEHKNIFVVGDDAQAIYAFRAATIENIMQFPKIFSDTKIFRLNRNYRSTQAVLDLANASILRNQRQFEKELQTIHQYGEKPELVGCANLEQEARFVIEKIIDLHSAGEPLKNIAVLFRAAYHAMQVELGLQKNHIPYIIRGGIRFFEQAHIKDIVAYLKLLSNTQDEIAWQRVLKLEKGIGDKIAQVITMHVAHNTQHDIFPLKLKGGEEGLRKILHRLEQLKQFADIDKMITYLLEVFYTDYVEANFENAGERLEDLEQLAIFARRYDSLDEFLSDVTLSEGFRGERSAIAGDPISERSEIGSPNINDYLVLSTIHQAKGLEWENVFVIGLVDGQFPHYKSLKRCEELEEERRLFYVAVTRAKKYLFLTYAMTQYDSFDGVIRRPSLFARELDPDLYKIAKDEDGWERVIEI